MYGQIKFCYNTFINLVHGRVKKLYKLQQIDYLKACQYVLVELISQREITHADEEIKMDLSSLYLELSSVQLQLANLAENSKESFSSQLSFVRSLVLLKRSQMGPDTNAQLCRISKQALKLVNAEGQDGNLKEFANNVQVQFTKILKSLENDVGQLSKLVKKSDIDWADSLLDIHKARTDQYLSIITSILEWCFKVLGKPPCQYALVGIRSKNASKLINPYSDLHNLFVLENIQSTADRQRTKTYFESLSLLFHLVLCSGDTIVFPKTLATRVLNDLLMGKTTNYLPISFLTPTQQQSNGKVNLPPPMLIYENFENFSVFESWQNLNHTEPAINKDATLLFGDSEFFSRFCLRLEQNLPLMDEIEADWNRITSLTSCKHRRCGKNVDLIYLMLARARRCKAAINQKFGAENIDITDNDLKLDDNITSCLAFISAVATELRLKMGTYLFVGSNKIVPSFVEIVGKENAIQYFKCVLTIYDLVVEQNTKCWRELFVPLACYELGLFEEAVAGCKKLSESADCNDLWLRNIVFYSFAHLRNPKAVDLLLDMNLDEPFVNLLDACLVFRDVQLNFGSICEDEHAKEVSEKEEEIVQCLIGLKETKQSNPLFNLLLESSFDQVLRFENALRVFETTKLLTGVLLDIDMPHDVGISCMKYKHPSKYDQAVCIDFVNYMNRMIKILNVFPNRFSLVIAISHFALAKAFLTLQVYERANIHFKKAHIIWQMYGYVDRTVLCYKMEGLVAFADTDYSLSLDLYKKAIKFEKLKGSDEKGSLHQARSYTTMAHGCRMLDEIYEMEMYTNKVKQINSQNYGSKFVLLNVSCQMLIGRSFYDEHEFEIAQKLYEDSIDTIVKLTDFEEHVEFYYFNMFRLGCCFCRQSMFGKAMDLFECSLRSNVFESRTQSIVALWCGTCLNRMQRYHEALQYLKEFFVITTTICRDLTKDPYAFDYFTTLGFASSAVGYYKESVKSYEDLLAILLQRQTNHPNAGYEFEIARCQFHKAGVYYRLGKYEEARELTLLYKKILEKEYEQYQMEIAYCHKLHGQCYYAQSQFVEAAQVFQCELKIRQQITENAAMDNGLAWCKFNLGKCYFALKQHKLAAAQFEDALATWKTCNVNHLKSKRKIITCRWWLDKSNSVIHH